jgi:hypothetical protein
VNEPLSRDPLRKLRRPGSAELEKLLDAIEAGSIRDQDDLDDAQVALLRQAYGHDEDLESLLDQLRGPGRDR